MLGRLFSSISLMYSACSTRLILIKFFWDWTGGPGTPKPPHPLGYAHGYKSSHQTETMMAIRLLCFMIADAHGIKYVDRVDKAYIKRSYAAIAPCGLGGVVE